MAESGNLTPLQERFCEEYLTDLNGGAAYRRAGYKVTSDESAKSAASRLLTNVNVQARIAELKATRKERLQVDADNVLRELLLIAHSDIGEVLDFTGEEPRLRPANQIPVFARKAISSFKVRRYTEGHGDAAREVEVTEFKLWDKLSAADKLARHCGLLVERHEHTGKGGGPMEFRDVTTLQSRDITLGRGIVGVAGGDVPRDGGPQPVDT